ncbi:DUF6708 domain-containing protein [Pseudomonas sp. 18175]|uniref:DUF6708 domain-containing protein n=1 Tax=Pseudomonas sp. 18175 TaxID=3390056 RepID=UPI003D210893
MMFLFERVMWSIKTESPEMREHWKREVAKSDVVPTSIATRLDESEKLWEFYESASDDPTDAGSLYGFGENHIDVRGAFQEEKRGLIAFAFLVLSVGLNLYMFYGFVWTVVSVVISDLNTEKAVGFDGWFFGSLIVSLWFVMNYFLWKHTWRWVRVELFTQRHIVVRFNRITRHVYVNRPDYAGGVVTLPWDAVVPVINPEAPDFMGAGGFLVLGFLSDHSGAGYDELLMLGRPMHGNEELVGFWEFIRRFMEEGPEAVPKPKRLLTLRPLPVEPVRATLRFMSGFWRNGGKFAALITGTLLSPLIILHALSHWISLLLCWAPRWPKEIREAGQPGKPIPKLTTAEDFGPIIGANLRANTLKERSETPMPERPGWRPAARQQDHSHV